MVANPRKLRAIYQNERKSDRRDAQMLARIGRLDPALLSPVRDGTEEAQADLLRIKLRDSLVRARVALINSVRFTLKSLGYSVRNPSSERFHKVVEEGLPETLRQMIAPSVQALAELTTRIKVLEREINTLAQRKYPQTVAAPANSRGRPDHGALFCAEDRGPKSIRKCARRRGTGQACRFEERKKLRARFLQRHQARAHEHFMWSRPMHDRFQVIDENCLG